MTERFKLFVGKYYGVQKVDGEVIFDSIISMAEADVLVDLLNDLTEKNEQLKHDATVLIQANHDYRRENEQLKKEIESWKKHCITHGIAVPITWRDKND